jgi:hypothetical protein
MLKDKEKKNEKEIKKNKTKEKVPAVSECFWV